MSFPFVISAAVLLLALSDKFVSAGDFESTFRKEVSSFVSSLDEDQLAACLHDSGDQRRWEMRYTGGNRPGIRISQLNDDQRALMVKVLSMVLSPEGWKMANAVAFQDAKRAEMLSANTGSLALVILVRVTLRFAWRSIT